MVRHGEAANANTEAAEAFKIEFFRLVQNENYLLQQVFNCGETGLFLEENA